MTFSPFGTNLFGEPIEQIGRGPLADAFVMPPFSVLNAREGDWQDRKRAWLALGIESEVGRGDSLTICGQAASFDYYRVKEGTRDSTDTQGTSVFDPVLCELTYRWFCQNGGAILDPFAGGSVRGVVAGILGYSYWGCDLRAEQIDANEAQRVTLCPDAAVSWTCGDALQLLAVNGGAPRWADLVFTCPPYGDLERYSDDPRDLSTMEYRPFLAAWTEVLRLCEFRLKPNRFACVVVGDFRDTRGNYRGFVADTIIAARTVGLSLYNDAVLVTSVGSLPLRVSGQFKASRKLGKTHQNVLVFAKGAPSWMK